MSKIGMTYLKGAVPGFENFGNLPTDFVNSEGLVNGVKAHKELDALIIPGGTLIESQDYGDSLKKEIKIMSKEGKPVIGICAGFQLLSNQIDIGRKSEVPIIKEGLGLIDVDFSPLVSSDRVKAKVFDNSFLVDGQKEDVTGFHTHTYGMITGDAKPLFYSQIQRMNYSDTNSNKEYNIFSGAVNDDGNVIGTMIHNVLDENPKLVENIFKYIDASEEDIASVYERNKEYTTKLNKEIGIKSGINIQERPKTKGPKFLMIGSDGSESGKTFIQTGLAGAIRRRGYNVGLLKVGPDARDIIPGLYLTKGNMEEYSCIKIGHLGWFDLKDAIEKIKESDYDIVLIEGVMSVFTGILNEITPYSASEIAIAGNIPLLLVSGVNKGGIETSAVNLVSHANMLERLGVNVKGVILNKIYNNDIFENTVPYIRKNTNVDEVFSVDKFKMPARGSIPEIEIRYDLFSMAALETVERNLDIDKIINMAEEIEFDRYLTFDEIKSKFIN